ATFRVKPEPWPRMHNHGTLTVGTNVIENEFLRVEIQPNGALTITDRKTGEEFRNVNYFEDAGENGDCWWRWTPPADEVFNTLGLQANIAKVADGSALTTFSIQWTWPLPVGVTAGKEARATEKREITITSF